MNISLVLFLNLVFIVHASLCGRNLCRSCVNATEYVKHWGGSSRHENAIDCSRFLGSDWITVPSQYLSEDHVYAQADTTYLYNLYSQWYEDIGSSASKMCQHETQKLLCMTQFPPCASNDNYAVHPCSDVCESYNNICGESSIYICPQTNSTKAQNKNENYLNQANVFYNNAKASCFHTNYSIQPSECIFNEFECQNNGHYHPECSECVCVNGFTGIDCSSCTTDDQCAISPESLSDEPGSDTQNLTCYTTPYLQLDKSSELSCITTQAGLFTNLLGDVNVHILHQGTNITIDLFLYFSGLYSSYYGYGNPNVITCNYSNCTSLSSLQCSQYLSSRHECLMCPVSDCVINPNTYINMYARQFLPLLDLFIYTNTSGIFTCNGNECIWMQNYLYTQILSCTTGYCVPKIPENDEWNFLRSLYICLFLIPIILFALIVYFARPRYKDVRPITRPAGLSRRFSKAQVKDTIIMPAILETEVEENLDSPLSKADVLNELYWSDIDLYLSDQLIYSVKCGTINNNTINLVIGSDKNTMSLFFRVLAGQYMHLSKTIGDSGYFFSNNQRPMAKGHVYFNNELLNEKNVNYYVAYIGDYCELCMCMTVKEILEYNYKQTPLVYNRDKENMTERVKSIISELNLEPYTNAIISDLPYEQRIILRIGLEVMLHKKILLIDNCLTDFNVDDLTFILSYLNYVSSTGVIVGIILNSIPPISLSLCSNILCFNSHIGPLFWGDLSYLTLLLKKLKYFTSENESFDHLFSFISNSDDNQLEYINMTFKQTKSYNDVIETLRLIEYNYVTNNQNNQSSNDSFDARKSIKIPLLTSTSPKPNSTTESNNNPLHISSFSSIDSFYSVGDESSDDNTVTTPSMKHIFLTRQNSFSNHSLDRRISNRTSIKENESELYKRLSFSKQFSNLFIRLLKVINTVSLIFLYTLLYLSSGIVIGLLFYQLTYDRQSIEMRSSLFYLITIFLYLTGLTSKEWFSDDLASYEREQWNNYYSTFIYSMAYFLSDFIALRLLPSITFSVPILFISSICSSDSASISISKTLFFITIVCLTSIFSSILYTTLYLYAHTRHNPDDYYESISQIFLSYSILVLFSNINTIPYLSIIITVIAPPLLTYRLLMINEFTYQTFIGHILGHEGAAAIIYGEDILYDKFKGTFRSFEFYFIVLFIWILILMFVRERILSSIHIHNIWRDRRNCLRRKVYNDDTTIINTIDIERNSDIICISDDDIETINNANSLTNENL